uniref:Uncharacterized protein n=1 Tax=Astatotilapia calliptera TaxID=8154 RepID=A0AAX7VEW7_ASTCA
MENTKCIRKTMHDDGASVKMKVLLESLLCYCLILQLHNMFPRLFRWIKNHQVVLKNVETTIRDVKYLITYLKETLDPDMCQGFVDCFLIWKHKEEEFGIDDSHYSEENLIFTVIDLFVAGTDTTAATLRWGLLLMAKYPHIQEQVHEELRHVVGSRKVSADDRKNLPYTDAVIHEIQRLANILPVCLPHQTSRDVTFQGYFIKKGTIVFPLLSCMMRVNGRAHTLLTLLISWIRKVNLSGEMPSCPFLQVTGCVLEKVWLRWSSSSSSPPLFSAFASLLHLELQRMNWISHQLWDSPPLLHPISCVLSVASERGLKQGFS